jgi:hypothetical protein
MSSIDLRTSNSLQQATQGTGPRRPRGAPEPEIKLKNKKGWLSEYCFWALAAAASHPSYMLYW